jgi:hypothetical protein
VYRRKDIKQAVRNAYCAKANTTISTGGYMVTVRRTLAAALCVTAFVIALTGTPSSAQQNVSEIWRLAPSNSLLVVAFDTRRDNPSMKAIEQAEDAQTREMWKSQSADFRKALESFATLFGVSFDFAQDIASWEDQQCAFALLPNGKNDADPVFILASRDSAAADAALQKLVQPLNSVGKVTRMSDTDYPITSFVAKNSGVECFASASGNVVAFSESKAALKQALKADGFAAGSRGEKVFQALSGSMFYIFADPALLKMAQGPGGRKTAPALAAISSALGNGAGIGLSVVETGVKMRVMGFPSESGAAFIKQMTATQQQGVLTANPGIPSGSLAVASLPNLSGAAAFAGIGMPDSPIVGALQAISTTPMSAALTAALPIPAGVVSAMAASEQDAADKIDKILASAKQLKLKTQPSTPIPGVHATAIVVPHGPTVYLTQVSNYILLASDAQALAAARATINGEQPAIANSTTYKETLAGLEDSNLLSLYLNLAPVQGLGFLVGAAGLGQMAPLYDDIAKSLENVKALGIGLGLSDQALSATIFLRAKPEIKPSFASFSSIMAIEAAVLIPMFASGRNVAMQAEGIADIRQLTLATRMYASDNAGILPGRSWQEQLGPYIARLQAGAPPTAYAFNKNLAGLKLDKIRNPSDVVMFFEAQPGCDFGSRANATLPRRGQGLFAYADGHVMNLSAVPDQSHWVPKMPVAKPVKKAPAKKAPAVKSRR